MLENLSDEELMQKAGEDDVDAFEILFVRYNKAIFSYLARMTRKYDLAEDYTQDVFLVESQDLKIYPMTFLLLLSPLDCSTFSLS